jgi:acetoin utilization protein AcuB
MLVKNWMIPNGVRVTPDDTLQTALQLLEGRSLHRLPVMSGARIEGSIARSDIEREALKRCGRLDGADFDGFAGQTRVRDLMSAETIAVPVDQTIEETVALFVEHELCDAPVVDHKGLMVGMITRSELLRALVSVTGAQTGGILFAFMVPDRECAIKEVSDTIRDFGGRISSILTTQTKAPKDMHKLYIRVTGVDRFRLNPLSRKLEQKAALLYMIDRRELRKDISERTPHECS